MTTVMQGVRILEVAEHTFVPAASALLSDWGAEVIKIEPVERGDAMRGLASTGVVPVSGDVHALLEHSNRGKRSLALDLSSPEGLDILYQLAATADVFLTNKLPGVRKKLKIDVDDIRAHNPRIIYVRGTGQGERGPDADKGSYDSLAFWCRAGVALGVKRPEAEDVPVPPAPGFGDSNTRLMRALIVTGALAAISLTSAPKTRPAACRQTSKGARRRQPVSCGFASSRTRNATGLKVTRHSPTGRVTCHLLIWEIGGRVQLARVVRSGISSTAGPVCAGWSVPDRTA